MTDLNGMLANRRVAIIVGINGSWFEAPTLRNAESDARAMAKALRRDEFGIAERDIRLLTAAATEPLDRAVSNNLLKFVLSEFRDHPLDLLIFYFAGHAFAANGTTWLMPADGVADDIQTCIALSELVDAMNALEVTDRLLILDVCRDAPDGMHADIASELENVANAHVLCSCTQGERSYEVDDVGGGLYTQALIRALDETPRDLTRRLSAFDVHDRARQQVETWAQERHLSQHPISFVTNRDTVYLTPGLPALPGNLNDRTSRTEKIVSVLNAYRHYPQPPDIRIHARLSSLSISDHEHADDPDYQRQLLQERDQLIDLFANQRAALKVMLSWGVWQVDSAAQAVRASTRIKQLLALLNEISGHPDRLSRFEILLFPLQDRNVMIIGEDYLFEGRQLDVGGGFDTTTVFTDPAKVTEEIVVFDRIFDNGDKRARKALNVPPGIAITNRQRLEYVAKGLRAGLDTLEDQF